MRKKKFFFLTKSEKWERPKFSAKLKISIFGYRINKIKNKNSLIDIKDSKKKRRVVVVFG